jgi:hypothetical protein
MGPPSPSAMAHSGYSDDAGGPPARGMRELAWREGGAIADQLLGILRPFPAKLMDAYPVNRRVGNVRNNDPALLDEIAVAA